MRMWLVVMISIGFSGFFLNVASAKKYGPLTEEQSLVDELRQINEAFANTDPGTKNFDPLEKRKKAIESQLSQIRSARATGKGPVTGSTLPGQRTVGQQIGAATGMAIVSELGKLADVGVKVLEQEALKKVGQAGSAPLSAQVQSLVQMSLLKELPAELNKNVTQISTDVQKKVFAAMITTLDPIVDDIKESQQKALEARKKAEEELAKVSKAVAVVQNLVQSLLKSVPGTPTKTAAVSDEPSEPVAEPGTVTPPAATTTSSSKGSAVRPPRAAPSAA